MTPRNKRILITGACGSVGSELTKFLLNNDNTICAFDNSEDGLFRLEQSVKNKSKKDNLRLFFGDVRDAERLKMALSDVDIIFHCAALKHVNISEYNPFEAIKTNLTGVSNLIQSALDNDVKKVIFTSSDKAVNPSSIMGATKLIGERLFITANHYIGKSNTKFACVRFGNILNSNGSVLKIFKSYLKEGKPLPITSKEMTRFFITIEEAINLCLDACENIIGGEITVLNMFSSKIMDLAEIISNNKLKINEIGMKPGEKLFEELVTETEAKRTVKSGRYFIIIPESLEHFPASKRKIFEKLQKNEMITSSIRSDLTRSDKENLQRVLRSINF